MKLESKSQSIVIDNEKKSLTLWDKGTRQRMLIIPDFNLFQPVIDGHPVELEFKSIQEDRENNSISFFFGSHSEVSDFVLTVSADKADDSIDFSCEFSAGPGCQINSISFFPKGTVVTAYNLVNFRNRHHTPEVWPELLTGQEIKTDTYSGDWQFAPHPTLFVFRKLQSHLFFGALDMPKSFGMYLEMKHYKVENWSLDFGAFPNGQKLDAGGRFRSPKMRLFIRKAKSVYEVIDEFVSMLVRSGRIPDPSAKAVHSWWREPLYCTWLDQVLRASCVPPEALQEQVAECMAPTRRVFDEKMVREAARIIREEKLPFRTILLDEGWHVARGQWEAHPARFPDLRGLVDELHAAGFKVMVWWNWAEIEKTALVNPAHLMAGGRLNRHGCRVRDYSLASTQEEYLKPLFHKLFSSDKGSYDLDGVKTDFLADKVHPDMSPSDPDWRGEENYFHHVTRLFYGEMRKYKDDAMHMGCCGNFWLAEFMDTNRTYDVHNSDYLEHETRGRMLKHTAPGAVVSYDLLSTLDNLDKYVASARKNDSAIQIGNVLHVQNDWFSEIRPADKKYYRLLRKLVQR
ncbi:MAG: TIM-barrel domain-containing protein [Victivallales bacterium]